MFRDLAVLHPMLALGVLLLGGIWAGLLQVAAGQVLGAVREIALNTRASAGSRRSSSDYLGLRILGGVMVLFGVLTIIATAIAGAIVLQTSRFTLW